MVYLQYCLPKKCLTRAVAVLAQSRRGWIKNRLIQWAMRYFGIGLDEAEIQSIDRFEHFNAFFTRALIATARPIAPASNAIVAGADGVISEQGIIQAQRLFQAKGRRYALTDLLQDQALASEFEGGLYSTIYLSPKDYHRVHMPLDGQLLKSVYVPGTLFSVNEKSTLAIPQLMARNERLYAIFETAIGPIIIVFVGALLVAGIETVWQKKVADLQRDQYIYTPDHVWSFKKGQELGRFYFGSTIIMILPRNAAELTQQAYTPVKMGQTIATLIEPKPAQ